MKKILSLIFNIFIIISIFSQDLELVEELFNSGISSYQAGDFHSAKSYFEDALDEYNKIDGNNAEYLMSIDFWLGATFFNINEYNLSLDKYLSALDIAEDIENIEYLINISTAIANLYNSLSEYEEAGLWFLKSSDYAYQGDYIQSGNQSREYAAYLFLLSGDYKQTLDLTQQSLSYERPTEELVWIYQIRGNANYNLKNFEDALHDYNKTIELEISQTPSYNTANSKSWIGKILFDIGNTKDALVYFKQALNISKDLQIEDLESRILGYIGFLYSSLGDYNQGTTYYTESLNVAKRIKNTNFIISALESLLWQYQQVKDYNSSIEILKELIFMYQSLEYTKDVAINWNDLGLMYYYNEQYKLAENSYRNSITYYQELNNNQDLSTVLVNLSLTLNKLGETKESFSLMEKALEISRSNNNTKDYESNIELFGYILSSNYAYKELISLLKGLLPKIQENNQSYQETNILNNIGINYYELHDYQEAINYYLKAEEISKKHNYYLEQGTQLHNQGQSYAAMGEFDVALKKYQESLEIIKVEDYPKLYGNILNSIGELYRAWGWYEKSLTYYQDAKDLFLKVNDKSGLASVYNNIGQSFFNSNKIDESLINYEKSNIISHEIEDKKLQAISLSNMGNAYRVKGNLEEAKELYQKSLSIDVEIKNLKGINTRKNNLALIEMEGNNVPYAIEIFNNSLAYSREINDIQSTAYILNNLGYAHFKNNNYQASVNYYSQAVDILERLRKTAKGSSRREFLESQVQTYRDLSNAYFHNDQVLESLFTMELSKSKYLLEQMGSKLNQNIFTIQNLKEFFSLLGDNKALVSFNILNKDEIQISLISNKIQTWVSKINPEDIMAIYNSYERDINRNVDDQSIDSFTKIIQYYRYLLGKPINRRQEIEARDNISKWLYDITFSFIEPYVSDKKTLIIVPDGILGYIPFETLKNPNNNYLVEEYNIGYSQSISVALEAYKRNYNTNKLPLLAFGGAKYEDIPVLESANRGDFTGVRDEVTRRITNGESTRGLYSRMGVGQWSELPGSLDEVNELKTIINGSLIKTGEIVNENTVKVMSNTNELSNFKVLHFATHGIVVPNAPELSAIVLSQFQKERDGEDGYLTMDEISKLKIEADFVNLSACETGLGKVYKGEGIVGLSQAFLIAGAKSLSVSLWQVSDESTKEFMTGLYKLVNNNKMDYLEGISEMKRTFLKQNKYSTPFFWAPFVYYGSIGSNL